jgi:threonine dehydrogenase-like Zn-dependent dehydrogenase
MSLTNCDSAHAEQAGDGFDLIYELSGNPAALDQAIAATGFDGRVVIGSWWRKAGQIWTWAEGFTGAASNC